MARANGSLTHQEANNGWGSLRTRLTVWFIKTTYKRERFQYLDSKRSMSLPDLTNFTQAYENL